MFVEPNQKKVIKFLQNQSMRQIFFALLLNASKNRKTSKMSETYYEKKTEGLPLVEFEKVLEDLKGKIWKHLDEFTIEPSIEEGLKLLYYDEEKY